MNSEISSHTFTKSSIISAMHLVLFLFHIQTSWKQTQKQRQQTFKTLQKQQMIREL